MSSGESDTWTSITVRRSLYRRLETFCDTYSISGKGEAIDTLLTIADAAGIPISDASDSPIADELNVTDASQIQGFLLDDGESGAAVVGTDGNRVRIITDVSEPESPVQPMVRTKITHGKAICPACGDTVLEYELSESFPGIDTGVFNSLTVQCETCSSPRPHYTLFAARPDKTPTADILHKAITPYLAYVLIIDSLTPEMFEERVSACTQLAADGGWEWLPDPSEWVGFTIDSADIGPVTPAMYADFLKSYLRVLAEDVEGVRIMELRTSPPEEADDYLNATWQLHLETRGADPTPAATALQDLADGWTSVSIDVERVDADTFADDTLVVSLPGLAELKTAE